VGRLLRQLHAVNHRVCPGPLSAAVTEGRLIRAWSPDFKKQGKGRKRNQLRPGRPSDRAARRPARRRPARRPTWSTDQLAEDPVELLTPMVERLLQLADQRRYEEAAAVRDEAEQLRRLLSRHRQVESLRAAGRVLLFIEGEGTVELEDGLLVDHGGTHDLGRADQGESADGGLDAERMIISQWLEANPERVRIVEVSSHQGISVPSGRIPSLAELCGDASPVQSLRRVGSAA